MTTKAAPPSAALMHELLHAGNAACEAGNRMAADFIKLREVNRELLEALELICAQAESWHSVHGHGPDSVQCDSICKLIPKMQAAIAKGKS